MSEKNYILNKEEASLKLQRLALEIAEQLSGDETEMIVIGIRNSGMVIAEKIGLLLHQYIQQPVKIIGATLNKANPEDVTLSETVDFTNKNIIVCDDVANSGKTLLYALKPLLQAHPKRIQILVLVERMHKLFPVKPDYVGLSIATTIQEHIVVEIENNEVIGAYIE
jgi:pyrimidine operon attenuation protein/uracil phosphoribosyltransferase